MGGPNLIGRIFLILMVVYVVGMSLFSGYMTKKKDKGTVDDWYAASSSIPMLGVGLAMAAAWLDMVTVFLNVDEAFFEGFSAMWFLALPEMIAFVVIAIWLAKRVRSIPYLSQPEMLEARFTPSIRPIYSLIWTVALTGYGALSFMIFSQTLGLFFGWHPAVSSLICMGIILSYQMVGGFLSSVYADYIQCILAIIGGIAIGIVSINLAGGMPTIVEAVPEFFWNPVHIGGFAIATYLIALIPAFSIEPTAWMRVKAAKNIRAAKGGMWIAFLIYIPTVILTVLAGIAATQIFPGWDRTYPLTIAIIHDFVPPLLAAVILTGVMAALISSMAGFLFAANLSLCYDFVPSIYKMKTGKVFPEKWIRPSSRIGMIVIGLFASFLAISFPTLLDLLLFSGTISAAGMFWPVIAMLYWKRVNTTGAYAGLILGSVSVLIWQIIGAPYVAPIWIGFPLSLIGVVVGSLATPPSPKERVEPFFQKASDELGA